MQHAVKLMNGDSSLEFGKTVRAHRRKLGLNQEQYGKRFEVNRITVSRWEAGTATPAGDHMTRLLGEIQASDSETIETNEDTYQLLLPLDRLVGLELRISPGKADGVEFQARARRIAS